jgi:hypothetical protein
MAWMVVCTPINGYAKTVYHTGFAREKEARVWGNAHLTGRDPCEIIRDAKKNGITTKVEPVADDSPWLRLNGQPVKK